MHWFLKQLHAYYLLISEYWFWRSLLTSGLHYSDPGEEIPGNFSILWMFWSYAAGSVAVLSQYSQMIKSKSTKGFRLQEL